APAGAVVVGVAVLGVVVGAVVGAVVGGGGGGGAVVVVARVLVVGAVVLGVDVGGGAAVVACVVGCVGDFVEVVGAPEPEPCVSTAAAVIPPASRSRRRATRPTRRLPGPREGRGGRGS